MLLELLHVRELRRIESRIAPVAATGEQRSVLVEHAHAVDAELRHAARDEMHDAIDLRAIELASRMQGHHDRRRGLLLIAQEHRRLGNGEVHARGGDGGQRLNGPRELAFEPTLIVDLFLELGRAEFLVVDELEADVAAARQALRGEAQPDVMHLRGGHENGAAAFGDLVRHVLLR